MSDNTVSPNCGPARDRAIFIVTVTTQPPIDVGSDAEYVQGIKAAVRNGLPVASTFDIDVVLVDRLQISGGNGSASVVRVQQSGREGVPASVVQVHVPGGSAGPVIEPSRDRWVDWWRWSFDLATRPPV